MAKRHAHAVAHEEENADRWLVTYADMITLLLAFFIMMYAMSVLNQGKFAKMMKSFRVELGIESSAAPIMSVPEVMGAGSPGVLAGEIAGVLEQQLGPRGGAQVQVYSGADSVTIRLPTDGLFFAPGSAEVRPALRRVLHTIAEMLWQLPNAVRIEGHTCNLPIANGRYPSNWELSAQRAINVLLELVHEEGLPTERFAATAFAATRPVQPNNSERNRRQNRRVDLVLVGVGSAPRLRPAAPPEAERPPPFPVELFPKINLAPQAEAAAGSQ